MSKHGFKWTGLFWEAYIGKGQNRRRVNIAVPEDDQESVDALASLAKSFNEFWDEAFGGCEMGTYSFTASEVLYGVDPMAYRVECDAYSKDEVDA